MNKLAVKRAVLPVGKPAMRRQPLLSVAKKPLSTLQPLKPLGGMSTKKPLNLVKNTRVVRSIGGFTPVVRAASAAHKQSMNVSRPLAVAIKRPLTMTQHKRTALQPRSGIVGARKTVFKPGKVVP